MQDVKVAKAGDVLLKRDTRSEGLPELLMLGNGEHNHFCCIMILYRIQIQRTSMSSIELLMMINSVGQGRPLLQRC